MQSFVQRRLAFVIALAGVALWLFPTSGRGQRIETADIRAMERVLDRLVRGEVPGESVQTKGLWLDGYGVLFSVPYSPDGRLFPGNLDTTTASRAAASYYFRYLPRREVGAGVRASVDSAKAALLTFFSRWAGAMANLRPEHRVTVIVEFKWTTDFFPFPSGQSRDSEQPTRRLIATVRGEDVLAVRKGWLSVAALEDKVRWTEEKGRPSAQSELNILADIVNSHLRTAAKGLFAQSTRAVRVPDLGAVLVSSAYLYPEVTYNGLSELYESGLALQESSRQLEEAARQLELQSRLMQEAESDTQRVDKKQLLEALSGVASVKDAIAKVESKRKEEQTARAQQLERLEDDIVALLGRYGATLQTLRDDEQILVLLDLGSYSASGPTRLRIAVKMRDVRRLASEEISLQQFRKLAAVSRE